MQTYADLCSSRAALHPPHKRARRAGSLDSASPRFAVAAVDVGAVAGNGDAGSGEPSSVHVVWTANAGVHVLSRGQDHEGG